MATKTHTLPTGTMELALSAIASNYTGWDILDTFEDTMGAQPIIHSRVLDSMCWMLDSSCISQARNVLFTRFKDIDPNEVVDFDEFCQHIGQDLDHESLYDHESDEQTLAVLIGLRDQWHDAANSAAAADDRDYKSKTLRELMESEKTKPADVGTRTNFRKLAEMEAKMPTSLTTGLMKTQIDARNAYLALDAKYDAADDEGKIALNDSWNRAKAIVTKAELDYEQTVTNKEQRLYDAYMQADAAASAQRIETNKRLLPTILEILRTASRYAPASAKFSHLPELKQKQLTNFAIGSVDRCKLDVAKRLARQPIAFGHAAEAAYECSRVLNDVIRQRFADAGDLENVRTQASIDHARGQKRKACAIE